MSRRANGEGTIYRRRDGRWEAAVVMNGRRRRHCAKTQAAARRWLTQMQRARDEGISLPGRKLRLDAYLKEWLERRRTQIRASTWIRYEQFIRLQLNPQLGKIRIADLTAHDVETFQTWMLRSGASPTSVHHAHATLHRALKDAERLDLVSRNVAALVSPPRVTSTEMHVLNDCQLRAFLAAASADRLAALWMLAATTGMREGELLGLRWPAIDWVGSRISVVSALVMTKEGPRLAEPKTARSRRRIAVAAPVLDSLRRRKAAQNVERLKAGPAWHDIDLVFNKEDGRPLRSWDVQKRFKQLLQLCELPEVRFHDLRHSVATLMLLRGVHPKIVSEVLGHTKVAFTLDVYSHVVPDLQEDVAAKMGSLIS